MQYIGKQLSMYMLFTGVFCSFASQAQSTNYFVPALSVGAVYDDNLYFSSGAKVSSLIARLSPEIDAGFETERTSLNGFYSFDAELYENNSQLNNELIRQHSSLEIAHQLSRLFTLNLDGRFDQTRTPGALGLLSGLNPGRNKATRLSVGPSFDYQVTPLTNMALGYTFTHDKLQGGEEADTHSVRTGIDREINQRNFVSLYYTLNRYIFDTGLRTTAHVPMLGWRHEFSPRTSMTIAAGPRISEGSTSPEVAVSMLHELAAGELSFSYDKTEAVVIGETGTVELDNFDIGFNYSFSPNLYLDAGPTWSVLKQNDVKINVYQLGLELSYRLSDVVSFVGTYAYSHQDGTLLDPTIGNIQKNVVFLSIKFSMPTLRNRPRGAQPR